MLQLIEVTSWDQLSLHLEARTSVPQILSQLRATLQEEWGAMPQQKISPLVYSMRRHKFHPKSKYPLSIVSSVLYISKRMSEHVSMWSSEDVSVEVNKWVNECLYGSATTQLEWVSEGERE